MAERRVAVLLGLYPEVAAIATRTACPLAGNTAAGRPGNARDAAEASPGYPPGRARTRRRQRPHRHSDRALFRSIALTAGAGVQGQGLGRTPVQNSLAWSVGPTLYWPFLDFGQLDAYVKVADFRTREAYFNYKKLVLSAVQDVNNALSNYAAQEDSLEQLNHAVEASRKAVHLASRRYENGLTDFLNVLDAQRQLYDFEDQYAVSQQNLIYQFVPSTNPWAAAGKATKPSAAPRPQPAILAVGAETSASQRKRRRDLQRRASFHPLELR